jgi:hypothetical protein
MTDPDIDFRVIENVIIEEILPDIKILYIPEEYVESKEKHYEKYLYSGKQYDYIFGHGIIAEGMPMTQFDNSVKSNEKKVPVFKSKELSSISRLSVWGHYHCHVDMGDGCYYLGSLFRDSFGEEAPKGYGIIEDDKFTFVENNDAYVYKTYTYDEDSDVYSNSDNILKEINRIKDENYEIFNGERTGKIRVIFRTPSDLDSAFRENIRALLFNDKHIYPLIKESSKLIEEVQEVIDTEYSFILDSSLNITDKIHRYINKYYGCNMTMGDLNKYLNEEFKL